MQEIKEKTILKETKKLLYLHDLHYKQHSPTLVFASRPHFKQEEQPPKCEVITMEGEEWMIVKQSDILAIVES